MCFLVGESRTVVFFCQDVVTRRRVSMILLFIGCTGDRDEVMKL